MMPHGRIPRRVRANSDMSAFFWLLQARIPGREPPSATGLLQTCGETMQYLQMIDHQGTQRWIPQIRPAKLHKPGDCTLLCKMRSLREGYRMLAAESDGPCMKC